MLKNYLIIAFRNLFKHKVYSWINISGLAMGICCSILIMLWVLDELSFDQFHSKSDRLHQVWVNAEFDGSINSWNSVPLPTYEAMKTANSHITNSVVTDWGGEHLLTVNDNPITKDGYYVSEEFLDMFDFPLLQGDPDQVLDDPLSIVITASTAEALFGDENPINKIVKVDNLTDLKVTGVLKDVPENSTFQFDFLLTWKYREQSNPWVVDNKDSWGNYSFQVFVELDQKDQLAAVNESIEPMLAEHGEEDMKSAFFLHPMPRWRLHSNFENGVATGGMSDYVQLFTVIAIFILVIACINFMNLATARAEHRAREVGVRKSIGSRRRELIFQFIGESMLISCLSFILAIIFSEVLLPFYNDLVDKKLFIDYSSGWFWAFAVGMILLTGLLAGSYPAIYLSSFQPARVLKGASKEGKGASTPRKVLVTIQFGFSILLIIGTMVIHQQIKLAQDRQLGYEQQNLITINYTDELKKNYKVIKNELLRSGKVEAVTISNSAITNINSNNFLEWPGKPEEQKVIFTTIASDYDYTKTMGIKVLDGRDFSEDFKSDTSAIIVNQAAMDIMDLDDPIGTQLDLWGDKRTLIGIVDNVLMGSPYDAIKPMFVILDPEWANAVTLRLTRNQDIESSLDAIKAIFEKHNPAYPFEYTFVDEEFQKKFATINMTSRLSNIFAILTLLITGLGILGLASYTAEQRTKEIGIRKVLGASVSSIVLMMSKDFSRLVMFSFLIAAPLSWWLLNDYLDRYPVRIDIPWWIFPFTGVCALLFALLVVTSQSLKAAKADPVISLKRD